MYLKGFVKKYVIVTMLTLSAASFAFPAVSESHLVYAAEAGTNDKTDIVKQSDGGWYYTVNGKVDKSYTGLAKNQNGWWYIKNGKVDFTKKDVLKGTVNGQTAWWFVSGGKVQFVDSIEQNVNGWWVIQKGKVNFNFNGFAKNQYGWWYCRGGKVDFSKNDVMKGTVNGQSGWWFVKGGKVQFVNSVEKNSNGWWVIQNGKVNFNYTGLAKNQYGWWYCKGGKVDFNKNTVLKGTVNKQNGWYNVQGGKVTLDKKTSFGSNENGTWHCENGKVTFKSSGYYVNNNKTYIFKGSKLAKVTNELTPLTELPGYYVSPMYAGNFNSSSERIEAMIKRAYDYLNIGTQYIICTSKRPGESVDCSGLVMQCLYAAGFDPYPATPAHHALPENEYDSRTLWSSVKMKHVKVTKDGAKYATEKNIDMSKLKRGDLIFYKSEDADRINHVAIYLGNGKVIEAVRPFVLDYLGLFHEVHPVIYGVARPFE
ncbi:MAG: C40 family peptidase [Eubacterium sp.]|nr:C40 family peptidase [Eubacterium sp.]